MVIAHLTTELAPIAKVGGLGDVVTGLSKALKSLGQKVKVILPFYDQIDRSHLENLKKALEWEKGAIYSAQYQGISLILITLSEKTAVLQWKEIYSGKEDIKRFSRFTQAALEYLLKSGKRLEILHLHDWPTALAASLYYAHYRSQGLNIGKVVLTLHNMEYQGVCSLKELEPLGLAPSFFSKYSKMRDLRNPTCLNLLKGGLLDADFLTTVSPTYAQEILGKEGFGLESILEERKETLRGILNGIDETYWNPETDPFLAKNYPPNPLFLNEIAQAKKENREALELLCKKKNGEGLSDKQGPLFTSISRLTRQKGPKWIEWGIEYVLKKGGTFILLGSSIEPDLKKEFACLEEKYRDHPRAFLHFSFDEKLAHLMYAAADCIFIPSLFEPCGLTQMIALRYGTIPIVHQVGGLRDTVFDIDHPCMPLEKRNGYTFNHLSFETLQHCFNRVFTDYQSHKNKWEQMQKNGLRRDWSWKSSAQKYLDLYRALNASKLV